MIPNDVFDFLMKAWGSRDLQNEPTDVLGESCMFQGCPALEIPPRKCKASTGKSMSPRICLFDPSKARIVMSLGRMVHSKIPNFIIVTNGHTLMAEPLSISTLATTISLHITWICKALLCPVPSGGSSSSENAQVFHSHMRSERANFLSCLWRGLRISLSVNRK